MIRLIKTLSAIVFIIWSFLVFISAMILVFPFILISSALFNVRQGQDIIYFFLKIWSWIFSFLCFFPLRVSGRKHIEPGKAYIYVSNHNSYLDAIVVVRAIPGSFKPLGKIEMVKVPVFGMIYKRVAVMIDRNSKESRAQSIEELKVDLARGQSILIFPEGTMNRSNLPLADFYDGAFRLAIEMQTPIIPMIILNARNLFPRGNPLAARPGLIKCHFLEPVQINGIAMDDLEDLKLRVYQQMESSILDFSN